MLEGYFVRTLGMHRVYNSAFMHMLRDENGAGYRKLIRETLEFDPEILKRYVNFMSNPDEKTALEQFGKGDKYFGVASVMATLPGLPMLGHGQVQGFGEKYGMEFRRATLDEHPDPWLAERHERELFPILHRRAWFAEAHDFLLYDFVTDDGGVDEDVLAYSNGSGPTRSLVFYHDKFGSTTGTIRESAPYARKNASGAKRMVRRSLGDGLGLSDDPSAFVVFRDARTGLEWLRSSREIREHGLRVSLEAYGGHVFWEFREVRDGSAGQWARLAARLGGRPVPSLEESLRELQLEPVHGPLRWIFSDDIVGAVVAGTTTPTQLIELEARFTGFLDAVAGATGVTGDPAGIAAGVRERTERAFASDAVPDDPEGRATLLAWLALSRTGELAPNADVAATSLAWFDELRLAPVLAAGLRSVIGDEGAAWAITDRVRVLLALARPSSVGGTGRTTDARLIERWLSNEVVRTAIGVNTWEGVEWLDRDGFADLLAWADRLDAVDAIDAAVPADPKRTTRLLAAAETADYRVQALRAAFTTPATAKTRTPRPATRKPGPATRKSVPTPRKPTKG
jgi:hypothetical protein